MLVDVGGECAGPTWSKTPIGYKTINVSLNAGVPNIFTPRPGFTPYFRVYLPGVGASYPSRINGFLIAYDP